MLGEYRDDKNIIRLPWDSGEMSMQNAAYGGCVLQIKADIKIYTTTLTTKESSKVHMRNIYIFKATIVGSITTGIVALKHFKLFSFL